MTSEEQHPMPLPIERTRQTQYLGAEFTERHQRLKDHLVQTGRVRTRDRDERRGVHVIIPSKQALEDWRQQSVAFAQHLKGLSSASDGFKATGKLSKKCVTTPAEDVVDRLRPGCVRVVDSREASQYCKAPGQHILQLVSPSSLSKQQNNTSIQLTAINRRKSLAKAKPASLYTPKLHFSSVIKTPVVQQSSLQSQNTLEPQQSTSTEPHFAVSSQKHSRQPNQKPWNPLSSDPEVALHFVKKNFTTQFCQAKSDSFTKFARRQSKLMKANSNLVTDSDSELSEKVVNQMLLVKSILEQTKQERQLIFEESESNRVMPEHRSKREAPSYKFDLRELFLKQLDGGPSVISDKVWDSIIAAQDDWHRIETVVEDALRQAHAGLHPVHTVLAQRTRNLLVEKLSRHGQQRTTFVNQMAAEQRDAQFKEELAIIAYMKRSGLTKLTHSMDTKLILKEFNAEASCHPKLVPRSTQALPKITGESQPTPSQSQASLMTSIQSPANLSLQSPFRVPTNSASLAIRHNKQQRDELTEHSYKTTQQQQQQKSVLRPHASIEMTTPPSQDQTFTSSDFWFHKGVVLNQKQQNLSAVQCYKHALRIDSNHLPSIFNLACNLEKLGEYSEAKSWFEHAIKVKPAWQDALYGLTLVCIRLEESDEALKHITQAIAIGGDSSPPHIKYALALSYRVNGQLDRANEAYSTIMKTENTIDSCLSLVDKKNRDLLEENVGRDIDFNSLAVDMYAHLRSQDIAQRCPFYIDLFPYYDIHEGWRIDSVPQVISLLQKVRFFNRFDQDALRSMLTRVTLKKMPAKSVLLLKDSEAAIVVSGQLHLLSHEEQVTHPTVVSIHNPGDVIGIGTDNGWYAEKHSWLCAWEEVHVFLIGDRYARYMWDQMKRFSANLIADIIDKAPMLSQMSEQTIFTIAHDIATFRTFQNGEVICHQDSNSIYNFTHQQKESEAVERLLTAQQARLELQTETLDSTCKNRLIVTQFEKHREEYEAKQVKELKKAQLEQMESLDRSNPLYYRQLRAIHEQKPKQLEGEMHTKLLVHRSQIAQQSEKIQATIQQASKVIDQSIQTLTGYQKDMKQLRKDSDGFYIIVMGECRVINAHDNLKVCRLIPGDYFGAGKFLHEQRYSYFGDVVALTQDKSQKQVEFSRSLTTNYNYETRARKMIDGGPPGNNFNECSTMCLHLSKDKLYLIPCYDLTKLRQLNLVDQKLKSAAKKCQKEYQSTIRQQQQRMQSHK